MAKQNNLLMIWDFLKIRKKWWLLPIVVFMLLISLVIVLTANTAVSPFVYTLF